MYIWITKHLLPTCQVDRGASVLGVGGARRRPLAEEGVDAVGVAPEGGQGQGGPPCLIPLVHVPLPLQQHLQRLSVAVVRLHRGKNTLKLCVTLGKPKKWTIKTKIIHYMY